jgi:hypothetical protein
MFTTGDRGSPRVHIRIVERAVKQAPRKSNGNAGLDSSLAENAQRMGSDLSICNLRDLVALPGNEKVSQGLWKAVVQSQVVIMVGSYVQSVLFVATIVVNPILD